VDAVEPDSELAGHQDCLLERAQLWVRDRPLIPALLQAENLPSRLPPADEIAMQIWTVAEPCA
jgi:hypothetical protein